MAAKNDFCRKLLDDCRYPLAQNFAKIALSGTVSEINALAIYAEIQDGCQKCFLDI